MNKVLIVLVLVIGLSSSLYSQKSELSKLYDEECSMGVERGKDVSDAIPINLRGIKKFRFMDGIYILHRNGECFIRKIIKTGKYCKALDEAYLDELESNPETLRKNCLAMNKSKGNKNEKNTYRFGFGW